MSYLDNNGLATLWAKIKQYVRDNAASSIPDLSVVTSKIADLAVTTAKIASNAVTRDKLSDDIFIEEVITVADNQTISPNTGLYQLQSVAKSGYKAIAIGGFALQGTNARSCVTEELYIVLSTQNLTCYVWNRNQNNNAVITLYVPVLYIKT